MTIPAKIDPAQAKLERLNAPISTPELERRWAAVRMAMEAAGVDVLLMQANNDYMGGYVKYFTDLPATQGYSVTLTFPRDAGMTLITQGPFGGDRALPPGGDGVRRGVDRYMTCPSYASAGYTQVYEADLAARALAPYADGVVGLVGLGTLSHHIVDSLKAALPKARFVDASDLVDAIKAIKSDEEIACLRATAAMQDMAMDAAFAAFRPGARDRDITAAATGASLHAGSEQGLYMCASTPPGIAAQFSDRHFQNRLICAGDQAALLIENSGPGGYYCELGRTAVLGRATAQQREELAFVKQARQVMLDMLRPGADCRAVWDAYNAFMRRHGREEENRLHCHGMGYDMVERPLVRFDEPMPLKAGMVVSCHPTYATDTGLHWLCDNYLLRDDGAERLHRYPEDIVELDRTASS
jgi:Xaa-Pro aminopeptidase